MKNNENNIVVKEKNNRGLIIVIIILLFIILGLCAYIVYDKMENNNKNNIVESNISEETTDEINENENISNECELSEEEIIKKLFVVIALNNPNNNEKLLDYKINTITYENDENIKSQFGYNNDDILVMINYDVKVSNENSDWIAGNGELKDDGWIVNKLASVVVKKDIYGNYYIDSIGTGW